MSLESFETLLKGEEGRGGAGHVLVREGAGGEGQGAREHKELKAHLLVCLKGARDGRRGLIGDEAVRGGGGDRRR